MGKIKPLCWGIGLSVLSSVLSIAHPAKAEGLNHAVTATNISNAPSIIYGNEAVVNQPSIAKLLLANVGTIQALLDSGLLSPEAQASLTQLSTLLKGINEGIWPDGSDLDTSIRDAAADLLKDVEAAQNGCSTDSTKCGQLITLFQQSNNFLESLQAFEQELMANGLELSIY